MELMYNQMGDDTIEEIVGTVENYLNECEYPGVIIRILGKVTATAFMRLQTALENKFGHHMDHILLTHVSLELDELSTAQLQTLKRIVEGKIEYRGRVAAGLNKDVTE